MKLPFRVNQEAANQEKATDLAIALKTVKDKRSCERSKSFYDSVLDCRVNYKELRPEYIPESVDKDKLPGYVEWMAELEALNTARREKAWAPVRDKARGRQQACYAWGIYICTALAVSVFTDWWLGPAIGHVVAPISLFAVLFALCKWKMPEWPR